MKKVLLLFLIGSVMFLTACPGGKKCKDGCGSYGECEDGSCNCPDYAYEIDGKCSGLYITNFIGSYATTSTFCDGSFPQGTALSCSRGSDNDKIQLQFGGSTLVFSLEGQVNNSSVSIPEQSALGSTWSGSGTLNGNLITLTVTRRSAGSSDCVYNIIGTK